MDKKLLQKFEEMDADERKKLIKVLSESKNSEEKQQPKLDWIYKENPVDREEYLLGRKIDSVITKELMPEKEDTNVPGALFQDVINRRSNLDMQIKMREDPLYAIRLKEEEARKRLLENPLKMKKYQLMVNKMKNEKKIKKKKIEHSSESADSDDSESDQLLKKYLSIVNNKRNKHESKHKKIMSLEEHKRHCENGGSQKSEERIFEDSKFSQKRKRRDISENYGDIQKKRKHKEKYKSSKEQEDSKKHSDKKLNKYGDHKRDKTQEQKDSEKHLDKKLKKHGDHKRDKIQEQEDSEKHLDKKLKKHCNHKQDKIDLDKKYDSKNMNDRDRGLDIKKDKSKNHESDLMDGDYKLGDYSENNKNNNSHDKYLDDKSPTSKGKRKMYGLILPDGVAKTSNVQKAASYVSPFNKPEKKINHAENKHKKKLSTEEMETKRQEMIKNARQRDDEREHKVKMYRIEQEFDEKKNKEERRTAAEFTKPMMLEHAASSSLEDRIKRNMNNIQRTQITLPNDSFMTLSN